ncbi:MAG: transposase [Thermoplasmataceae archaeon]|jgi:transposase-like protein|uniref:Transposase IS3/IS911 family protein n=1 Tax=mine drainage metagenome TaxID=410659 RepID=T1DCI7_9ZZZZ
MTTKTYTVEEKYNIIFESLSTNQPITEICRKYGISPSTYQIWKEQFLTGARSGLEGKARKNPYVKQVEELKATIADLAIANDALKKIQQGRKR